MSCFSFGSSPFGISIDRCTVDPSGETMNLPLKFHPMSDVSPLLRFRYVMTGDSSLPLMLTLVNTSTLDGIEPLKRFWILPFTSELSPGSCDY